DAVDPEGKAMTYTWKVGDQELQTKEPRLEHELTVAGEYQITVQVADDSGAEIPAEPIVVYAGNTTPEVDIKLGSNATTIALGERIAYEVVVNDHGRDFDPDNLFVSVKYIKGSDQADNQGHQQVSEIVLGRNLVLASDCRSCHTVNTPSVGPMYSEVAKRYKSRADAVPYLVDKIINGGSGAWGAVAMSAHPDIKPQEAQQMVQWIMSLGDDDSKRSTLPGKGEIVAQLPADMKADEEVTMRITAQYTNAPDLGITPLTGTKSVDLKIKKD